MGLKVGVCVSRGDPKGLLKVYGMGMKRSWYFALDILDLQEIDLLGSGAGLQGKNGKGEGEGEGVIRQ